jgi:transcriptional regulator with XRE-family HTH domain
MRVKDPKHIQRLMVIQDLSARQLARAAGYASHSYMTRILRGEIVNVTPNRAARIARCLQVGVDDLFVARLSTDTRQNVRHKEPA